MGICIGSPAGEHVTIRVTSVESVHKDYWLTADAKISVGGFTSSFAFALQPRDLSSFRNQLMSMHRNLKGEAGFSTIEGQLEVKLVVQRTGRICVEGTAEDEAGMGNRLKFHFEIDQSFLPDVVRALDDVETRIREGDSI